MEPALRPGFDPAMPPLALAPPPAPPTDPLLNLNIQIEAVKAEVAAEQKDIRTNNFYAWWLACEGYSSIF